MGSQTKEVKCKLDDFKKQFSISNKFFIFLAEQISKKLNQRDLTAVNRQDDIISMYGELAMPKLSDEKEQNILDTINFFNKRPEAIKKYKEQYAIYIENKKKKKKRDYFSHFDQTQPKAIIQKQFEQLKRDSSLFSYIISKLNYLS